MLQTGDRVEVVIEDDPLYGYIGVVEEVHPDLSFPRIAMSLEEDTGEGLGILWFDPEELRKVEQV